MKIEISVVAILIVLFIINQVLAHLMNWWARNIDNDGDGPDAFIYFLVYIVIIAVNVIVINSIIT